MALYVDPAVKAQQATRHDVCVIGRHEKHGYLLLLNCRAEGKEFRLPSRKFEHPEIGGDEYYKEARVQASREMRKRTGLSLAPGRFNRIYFPAQVQKRLRNKVFFEVSLYDHDSLSLGETAMTGEQDFWIQLEEIDGFTFHQDLRHAATALRGTSRTMAHALLATEAVYRETCCFGGIFMKMAEKVWGICGWP